MSEIILMYIQIYTVLNVLNLPNDLCGLRGHIISPHINRTGREA